MNTTNPFDLSKLFEQFDPQQLAAKIQETFKVDFDAMQKAQDKNLELLMSTNKAITESSQSLIERQVEMLNQAMSDATDTLKSLADSDTPQDVASKQAEMLQTAYEKALANSTEISGMVQKTQEEISGKVNTRLAESMEEFKEAIGKIA